MHDLPHAAWQRSLYESQADVLGIEYAFVCLLQNMSIEVEVLADVDGEAIFWVKVDRSVQEVNALVLVRC